MAYYSYKHFETKGWSGTVIRPQGFDYKVLAVIGDTTYLETDVTDIPKQDSRIDFKEDNSFLNQANKNIEPQGNDLNDALLELINAVNNLQTQIDLLKKGELNA